MIEDDSDGQAAGFRGDFNFDHDYSVEARCDFPSEAGMKNFYYYPGGRTNCGHDGVLIKVKPNGSAKNWYGLFAAGVFGRRPDGVYSCPDKNAMCVVAGGGGYIVDTQSPKKAEQIPVDRITDVRPLPDRNIILFIGYRTIAALGVSGIEWTTEPDDLGDVYLTKIDPETAWGTAVLYDEYENDFKLDLATGACTSVQWRQNTPPGLFARMRAWLGI